MAEKLTGAMKAEILFGKPGAIPEIEIRFAFRKAMMDALSCRSRSMSGWPKSDKAVMAAVLTMLEDCKKAGVDPVELMRVIVTETGS
jgi:hypothetical protein